MLIHVSNLSANRLNVCFSLSGHRNRILWEVQKGNLQYKSEMEEIVAWKNPDDQQVGFIHKHRVILISHRLATWRYMDGRPE